jgi:hypothetical protein
MANLSFGPFEKNPNSDTSTRIKLYKSKIQPVFLPLLLRLALAEFVPDEKNSTGLVKIHDYSMLPAKPFPEIGGLVLKIHEISWITVKYHGTYEGIYHDRLNTPPA